LVFFDTGHERATFQKPQRRCINLHSEKRSELIFLYSLYFVLRKLLQQFILCLSYGSTLSTHCSIVCEFSFGHEVNTELITILTVPCVRAFAINDSTCSSEAVDVAFELHPVDFCDGVARAAGGSRDANTRAASSAPLSKTGKVAK